VRRVRDATSARAVGETRNALSRLTALGAIALHRDETLYPQSFRDILESPYLLFAIGDISRIRMPAVAMVGTRSPSAYGRRVARELSAELALAGFAVVSGMARGIDTAAHLGALEAGGVTIGILGHGIEQIYPPENRRLFEDVRE